MKTRLRSAALQAVTSAPHCQDDLEGAVEVALLLALLSMLESKYIGSAWEIPTMKRQGKGSAKDGMLASACKNQGHRHQIQAIDEGQLAMHSYECREMSHSFHSQQYPHSCECVAVASKGQDLPPLRT